MASCCTAAILSCYLLGRLLLMDMVYVQHRSQASGKLWYTSSLSCLHFASRYIFETHSFGEIDPLLTSVGVLACQDIAESKFRKQGQLSTGVLRLLLKHALHEKTAIFESAK